MRSAKGLVIALTVLVPIVVVGSVIGQILAPTDITVEDGFVQQERIEWEVWAFAPFGIAALVLGVIWSFRVTSNARAVGDPSQPSAGWMVATWFIPVAHAVLPLFPLLTAWKKSRAGGVGVLVAWGVFWAVNVASGYVLTVWGAVVGFKAGMDAEGASFAVDLPQSLVVAGWVAQGAYAVAGILFIAVLWRMHGAQEKMAAWLARSAASGPAGFSR